MSWLTWPAGASPSAPFSFQNVDPAYIVEVSPTSFILNEYRAAKPPQIVIRGPSVEDCRLDGITCDPHQPVALKLMAKPATPHVFHLTFRDGHELKAIDIQLLGDDFPRYETSGRSVTGDLVVVSLVAANSDQIKVTKTTGPLLILDGEGGLVFYRRLPTVVSDFRPFTVGGRQYYSYIEVQRGYFNLTDEGSLVVLDHEFQTIKKFDDVFDMHETTFLNLDHFIHLKLEKTHSAVGSCLLSTSVIETENSRTRFNLKTVDLLKRGLTYPDSLLSAHIYEAELCREVLHLNTVQVVDSDHFLLGFLHSIVMYDKKKKKIDWVFGGPDSSFILPAGLKNASFHTAHWEPTTKTLRYFQNQSYDSAGCEVAEATLDVPAAKIISLKSIFQSPHASWAEGSVEKNGSVYSLYLGLKSQPDDLDFREIENGRQTFSVRFLPPWGSGYRAYRTPILKGSPF